MMCRQGLSSHLGQGRQQFLDQVRQIPRAGLGPGEAAQFFRPQLTRRLGHLDQDAERLRRPGTPEQGGPGQLVLGPDQGPGQVVEMLHHPAVGQLQAFPDPGRQAGLGQGLEVDRQVRRVKSRMPMVSCVLQIRQGLGHLPGQPAGLGLPGGKIFAPGKERQLRGAGPSGAPGRGSAR